MNIRLRIENIESNNLSKYAKLSKDSKGRKDFEEKCIIRTDFQRDRDRIIHSKSFRRLKHKTQVFIAPEGDHFRTRLTHTLEVAQIGRTLARALRLNEDLVEAIALGHDLGHTPFGHTGERVLNELHSKGFRHNEQSVRVVDFLEHKDNRIGLNLTYEVREGIISHSGGNKSQTLEGQVVKFADRIAYINHDIDDAMRANIIKPGQIPEDFLSHLGHTHGQRINTMILDIINNSMDNDKVTMSEEIDYYTNKLRDFLFENVYYNKIAKSEEEKTTFIIEKIFEYYSKYFELLPEFYLNIYKDNNFTKNEIIKDYIAGMTDRYAMKLFEELYIPKPWRQ